jgi:diguanylate cyclase (GGDEF)-like protein
MNESESFSPLPLQNALHILLVEDNPGDIRLFQEIMRDTPDNLTIDYVTSLSDSFPLFSQVHIDVIMLDLSLPDSNGIDTVVKMRSQVPDLPIIVLTGLNDEQTALSAVREGAQDYLIKGTINGSTLIRSIRYAIERNRMQNTLRALSLIDDLTGVYNRRGFMNLAMQQIRSTRRRLVGFHLIYIDLDDMKKTNEQEGATAGDQRLINAARLFSDTFRGSDVVARIGGDEFAIITAETEGHQSDTIIGRLKKAVDMYNQQNNGYPCSFSYGMVFFESAANVSLEHLLLEAEKIANSHENRLSNQ